MTTVKLLLTETSRPRESEGEGVASFRGSEKLARPGEGRRTSRSSGPPLATQNISVLFWTFTATAVTDSAPVLGP